MTRQAVILAGGKGTRLAERLNGLPKPLIDIDGVPLLARQLELISKNDFTDVLILVSHGADQIIRFCAEYPFSSLNIQFIEDSVPKGTAGALLAALGHLHDRFLVMYGDTLLDVDLRHFCELHEMAQAAATLFLHPNDHPYDSDLVEVDEDGWITRFDSYPHDPGAWLPNLVNAGLYVVERKQLAAWSNFQIPSDIAKNLFPEMVALGTRLKAYRSFEYIKDIGTPRRLDEAVNDLRSGLVRRAQRSAPQKAVLIDRDGTLCEERGHLRSADDLYLLRGIPQAIRRLNDGEFRVAIITNQPVLARGECTSAEMRRIHNRLETELGLHHAFVDGIYLCPHHPDRGYFGEVQELKVKCTCRKPDIGLLKYAQADLHIDFAQSWFVGDTTTDMLTAARAGLRSVLVQTGYAGADGKYVVDPDYIAQDFPGAVEFIINVYPKLVDSVQLILADARPGDVIIIGGLARQGKSTLAATLKSELRAIGHDAVILHLDRFIKSATQRGSGLLGRFDMLSAERALASWLRERCDIQFITPNYDRVRRLKSETGDIFKLSNNSVLIVEGVPALLLNLATTRRVYRIYVTGPEETRRDRVINDLVERGMIREEAARTYAARCRDETPLVEALRPQADVVWSFPIL